MTVLYFHTGAVQINWMNIQYQEQPGIVIRSQNHPLGLGGNDPNSLLNLISGAVATRICDSIR